MSDQKNMVVLLCAKGEQGVEGIPLDVEKLKECSSVWRAAEYDQNCPSITLDYPSSVVIAFVRWMKDKRLFELPLKEIQQLIVFAHEFDIQALETTCVDRLKPIKSDSMEQVKNTFQIAKRLQHKSLEKECHAWFSENFDKVIQASAAVLQKHGDSDGAEILHLAIPKKKPIKTKSPKVAIPASPALTVWKDPARSSPVDSIWKDKDLEEAQRRSLMETKPPKVAAIPELPALTIWKDEDLEEAQRRSLMEAKYQVAAIPALPALAVWEDPTPSSRADSIWKDLAPSSPVDPIWKDENLEEAQCRSLIEAKSDLEDVILHQALENSMMAEKLSKQKEENEPKLKKSKKSKLSKKFWPIFQRHKWGCAN